MKKKKNFKKHVSNNFLKIFIFYLMRFKAKFKQYFKMDLF